METLITNGIRVCVETSYQPDYSNPDESKFIYAYQITIDNLSTSTVQLLRRHWIIVESTGISREVAGDGVIGQQPVLQPGETHQYVSWCPLQTSFGKMYGSYDMINLTSQELFKVQIPEFRLIAPFVLN